METGGRALQLDSIESSQLDWQKAKILAGWNDHIDGFLANPAQTSTYPTDLKLPTQREARNGKLKKIIDESFANSVQRFLDASPHTH